MIRRIIPGELAWLKIVGVYALFGALWILFSDQAAQILSGEPPGPLAIMQSVKGLFFILVTSILLAVLIRGRLAREKASRDALAESERHFKALFGEASDGIFLVSQDGRYLDVNPRGLKLLGYEKEELLALRLGALSLKRDVERLRETLRRVRAGEHYRGAWELRRKDGTLADIELSAVKLSSGLFMLVVRDISQRRKAEKALRKAMRGARTASRAKSEFLANMSHEIRTPLNGVMGFLQALLAADPAEPPRREYLEMAMESARKLLGLLNDLLDLSRIESGKMPLRPAPFDPRALAETTTGLFRLEAEAKGIELALHVPGQMPLLLGDEVRIRQILINLIGNAVKYTERGSVLTTVRAIPRDEGPDVTLELTVKDTGIGIPEDKKDLIFEMFTQADSGRSRKYGGAGLGLPIVKKTVELMGGVLTLASEEGAGTEITVRLGLERVSPDALAGKPPLPPEPERAGQRLRVLVVEDDRINQIAARVSLERLGHRPLIASSGQEALNILEREPFDAALIDIHMPGMDGLELLAAIRASGKAYAGIPAAALTAHAMSGDRERFLEAGMDAYLSKPVEIDELARGLRQAMERATARRRGAAGGGEAGS